VTAQERAESAARELVLAVAELCSERYGDGYKPGDYAVILRSVVGPDGFTYTWDWFWKTDSHGGGGSG
jgi:hypothetical protein